MGTAQQVSTESPRPTSPQPGADAQSLGRLVSPEYSQGGFVGRKNSYFAAPPPQKKRAIAKLCQHAPLPLFSDDFFKPGTVCLAWAPARMGGRTALAPSTGSSFAQKKPQLQPASEEEEEEEEHGLKSKKKKKKKSPQVWI